MEGLWEGTYHDKCPTSQTFQKRFKFVKGRASRAFDKKLGIDKILRPKGPSKVFQKIGHLSRIKFSNCLSSPRRIRNTDFDGYIAKNINDQNLWNIKILYSVQNLDFYPFFSYIKKVTTSKTQCTLYIPICFVQRVLKI